MRSVLVVLGWTCGLMKSNTKNNLYLLEGYFSSTNPSNWCVSAECFLFSNETTTKNQGIQQIKQHRNRIQLITSPLVSNVCIIAVDV